MDGFSTDGVYSCYNRFVILVIACNYLPTQGADLCKLCLYLLGYSWVSCSEFAMEASSAWMSFLVVRTFSSSSASSFFRRSSRFMLADTSALASRVAFFLVEGFALLSYDSFQRNLRTTCLYSLLSCLHLYPEEREMAGWPKFDLK